MMSTGGRYAPFSFVMSPICSMRGKRIFDTSMGNGSISLAHIGSLMLSAGEVPRIAGSFGLDTTTKANITSAVYTAQSAVNVTRTIAAAIK